MKKRIIFIISLGVLFIGIVGVLFWQFQSKEENNYYSLEKSDDELRERIGQMLIVGFRGTEVSKNSYITKAIKDLNLGGVILFDFDVPSKSFPRNILSFEQTKGLVKNLKKFSSTPLIIAVDAEGGLINRLKPEYGFITIPSHQELGEKDDLIETKKISSELARELSELGFNTNFAPVVDVNINPENPVVGSLKRSFSNDSQKVVSHSRAFIEGQHEYNIITSVKHFPGHGSSREDSHKGMVDITETYKEEELTPYQELIKEKAIDMVMTAHIINRKIDPKYPATLSQFFIKDILRKQLNFEGVVVSDDMQMEAITENYGFEEAIIRAINAGCDLLIISNNGGIYDESGPYQARDIIFNAVQNGRIPVERIIESSDRIYLLKSKFGVI